MILTTLAIIGLLVGAGATIYSAQEKKKTADYTAKLAEEAGEESRVMAGIEADRHRDRVKRLQASQRAGYAKSGVLMEGSPLEVLADTQAQADLDEMLIRHGGAASASGYAQEAFFAKRAGRSAQTAGYLQAGSSLLSGAYKMTK